MSGRGWVGNITSWSWPTGGQGGVEGEGEGGPHGGLGLGVRRGRGAVVVWVGVGGQHVDLCVKMDMRMGVRGEERPWRPLLHAWRANRMKARQVSQREAPGHRGCCKVCGQPACRWARCLPVNCEPPRACSGLQGGAGDAVHRLHAPGPGSAQAEGRGAGAAGLPAQPQVSAVVM